LRDIQPEIERRGARLVVIGNGTPEQARDLRTSLGFTGLLWVDPEMAAYRAAGLRRGASQALSWRMLGHMIRALKGGHRQAGVQGDPWQLGGVFVVAASQSTHLAHISREAGDHAGSQDILEAVDRAVAAG
jgi:hypothetical protein